MKKTWDIIRQVINKSVSDNSIKSLCINDTKITDRTVLADNFNKFFVNIGAELAQAVRPKTGNYLDYLAGSYPKSCFFYPTNNSEVINIVHEFKNKTCSGIDRIPLNILKA